MSKRALPVLAVVMLVLVLSHGAALAQFAHHPFAVGANEGAVGHQNAFGAWILAQESRFSLQLNGAVHATRTNPAAAFLLVAVAFAYGIFHAAGPGHGKAVITTYMVANEVALRRGLVIAGLAAIVQALVAVVPIGIAVFVFNATAQTMTLGAQMIERASYLGIIAFGLLLVWRKGRALKAAFRFVPVTVPPAMAFAGGASRFAGDASRFAGARFAGAGASYTTTSRFTVDDGTHPDDCDCGRSHMPDPATLAGARFDARTAAYAVLLAGARPCTGAMLVLIFAASQKVFLIGVLATFAMAAGTATTTGALATAAVFAKDMAVRLSGSRRSTITLRVLECGAAIVISALGILMFGAAMSRGA